MKLSFLCHAFNVVVMALIGCLYIFSNEFMPFHSDIIQTPWENVGTSEKILYLGMMRTEGAGFLASAVAISILLAIPFREGKVWSYWAIPTIGIVEYLPTLIATFYVSRVTQASPPWPLILFAILLLLAGLVLSITDRGSQVIGHRQ